MVFEKWIPGEDRPVYEPKRRKAQPPLPPIGGGEESEPEPPRTEHERKAFVDREEIRKHAEKLALVEELKRNAIGKPLHIDIRELEQTKIEPPFGAQAAYPGKHKCTECGKKFATEMPHKNGHVFSCPNGHMFSISDHDYQEVW
jgi:hypothetical protein